MEVGEWPIIVGGCHRSGTSLVRRLLDSHSRIFCGPEIKFFRDFYGDYPADPLSHLRYTTSARSILPEDDLLELLGQGYVALLQRAATRAGKPRWADKNPENALYLPQWEALLGERWLFVHVVRNPLDTLASMQEARFDLAIPVGLRKRIAAYRRFTEAGIEYSARHPERCYRLVYERLVAVPHAELTDLMNWLGETVEPAQFQFNNTTHQTGLEDPKVSKTTQIHAGSIGRWADSLAASDAQAIWAETSDIWNCVDPDGSGSLAERVSSAHPRKWREIAGRIRRRLVGQEGKRG